MVNSVNFAFLYYECDKVVGVLDSPLPRVLGDVVYFWWCVLKLCAKQQASRTNHRDVQGSIIRRQHDTHLQILLCPGFASLALQ